MVGCHFIPPSPWLPYQLYGVTVLRPVWIYTVWWQRHMVVNNFAKVTLQHARPQVNSTTSWSKVRHSTDSTAMPCPVYKRETFALNIEACITFSSAGRMSSMPWTIAGRNRQQCWCSRLSPQHWQWRGPGEVCAVGGNHRNAAENVGTFTAAVGEGRRHWPGGWEEQVLDTKGDCCYFLSFWIQFLFRLDFRSEFVPEK